MRIPADKMKPFYLILENAGMRLIASAQYRAVRGGDIADIRIHAQRALRIAVSSLFIATSIAGYNLPAYQKRNQKRHKRLAVWPQ